MLPTKSALENLIESVFETREKHNVSFTRMTPMEKIDINKLLLEYEINLDTTLFNCMKWILITFLLTSSCHWPATRVKYFKV